MKNYISYFINLTILCKISTKFSRFNRLIIFLPWPKEGNLTNKRPLCNLVCIMHTYKFLIIYLKKTHPTVYRQTASMLFFLTSSIGGNILVSQCGKSLVWCHMLFPWKICKRVLYWYQWHYQQFPISIQFLECATFFGIFQHCIGQEPDAKKQ